MTSTRKRLLAAFAAAILAASLSACDFGDKISEPFNDAPRGKAFEGNADVITMPDGFSNLATKCVGGVRYTVVFHGDALYGDVSTLLDPACTGK